ncbi:MAG: ferredoxin domain-containing protein [Bacillota bacterium]
MEALEQVARLMELSAHTAPKAGGKNYIVTKALTGEALKILSEEMIQYGLQTGKKDFDRDAKGVALSDALLLIALNEAKAAGLNCGACGMEKCNYLEESEGPEFAGGICAWRFIDLGIALGSAVKTANMLNADNRIMYRIGVVARAKGFINGQVVVGIPLAGYGKNIFFDR